MKNNSLYFFSNSCRSHTQILKQEWPRNWNTFIPEIVGASQKNESLCENNMDILKLLRFALSLSGLCKLSPCGEGSGSPCSLTRLSEEIFDFSKEQMTQAKVKELKEAYNQEFSLIYQLCDFILRSSSKPSLINATLETLLRFLNWIPPVFIFQTKMIEHLLFKVRVASKKIMSPFWFIYLTPSSQFFVVAPFQNVTLKCLTEIVGISMGDQNQLFVQLFVFFMQQLKTTLPPNTSTVLSIILSMTAANPLSCHFQT